MTIVCTIVRSFAIVASCDSAVKEDIDGEEPAYSSGRKGYPLPGIGVVTTWGARDGNQVGRVLERALEEGRIKSVEQAARLVESYLRDDFAPQERGAPDVGFHVAGFIDERPHLYHVFWQAPGG